jgi:hypothetical protein
MGRLHVSLSRVATVSDAGGQVPVASGRPVASTLAALITTTAAWAPAIAGVQEGGRTASAGQELVPLAAEGRSMCWRVTASGSPMLVTVVSDGATPTDPTFPTYLIMNGASLDIGCGAPGNRLWARDIVL